MKKAFTLIEILIVVILLGILAAVVIPQFVDQTAVVNQNAAATEVANLNSAWQQYVAAEMAAGRTPATGTDFPTACGLLIDGKYIDGPAKEITHYTGYTMAFTPGATAQLGKFSVSAAAAGN